MKNIMLLNDEEIGVSKIEFDKDGNFLVHDKSGRYCFSVCTQYNIKDINEIAVGEKKDIRFNEYYISENNEPALIWPSSSTVERINEDDYCFDFEFDDLTKETTYMNMKGTFDNKLKSFKCILYIKCK